MPFYTVAKGRKEGIYTIWTECEQQVKKKKKRVVKMLKKFTSLAVAIDFLLKHQADSFRYILEMESSRKGFQQVGVTLVDNSKVHKAEAKVTKLGQSANTKPLKIGHYVFNASDDGYVNVYIGGHSEIVGYWNCVEGYLIYFEEGHPLNVPEAATGRLTRNVGDIKAAIEAAIEAIEIAIRIGIPKLCLHTKSKFLLNAVKFWMNTWKRHGWRNKAGKVVQNQKQFERLYSLINENNINLKWAEAPDDSGSIIEVSTGTVFKLDFLRRIPFK